ncbi:MULTISPECIES: DUF2179 domain-containing protein [Staphylococcus]|jgi:uncharacterized protein YebE (UPF0316 family)|uniref:UPF0316 protein BUZ61_04540 n=1 Tax=Staphylococcus nepalensis TaxID=214473 RepID=A0A291JIX1_9STAP|nr:MULTISPECIES: DUF2179 domain-containing protein [Staphylococcus]VDG66659.1 Uncharacterized protein conserved in bacteria (DUF2179) [Lacrimispora indolis]ATH59702.1 hypothetical protein BJD96_04825 [Staphylococcus nepalensis]ATH64793.1 hypothetical protein BJG89_05155 [Staphylococcus nepalensis]AWI44161.1 hypothetical protein BJG88_04945 [Staphylococcus nepalensis]MBO1206874.1 DUF2179 domain-containing protein [Staphylococcus nepalensis]
MSVITSNPWLMVLAIFIINVAYVTCLTMRTILTLKGYRYVAAVVSFLEVLVYVIGLGMVMSSLDQIQNVFAYAFGFSIGIIVGMKIEEKLALGYTVVNVTSSEHELDLPKQLRDLGYGVTHNTAYGRDGARLILQILTPRRFELKLIETIKQIDEKAFIIAYEPRTIHGGFWVKGVRSKKLKQYDPDKVESI